MAQDKQIVYMILNCGIEKIAPKVILPATNYVAKQICKHFKVKPSGRTWRGKYKNSEISVVESMIGNPASAMTMEALARAKVEYIIRVDYCGGLTEEINVGDIILSPSAICGDGTTPHYLTSEAQYPIISADSSITTRIKSELEAQKIEFHVGPIWTHDAIFKEPPELLEKAKTQGAIAIDMETSAIFALGQLFHIPTAAVMVATDNPGTGEVFTKKITITPRVLQNLDKVIDCVLTVLSSLNSSGFKSPS